MVYGWMCERIAPEELANWKVDLLSPIPGLTREGVVEQELIDAEMSLFTSFKQATGN
jgi:hypothetical protein